MEKSQNDAFGYSRATQVLMETPETVKLTEFHPRYTNEQVNVLVHAVDGYMHEATIKLKIADKKTYNNSLIQQPNCLELVLHGEQSEALNK